MTPDTPSPPKGPHWLTPVALLALVWYVLGTFVIVSSRYMDPLDLSPVQRAFTGFMPSWAHIAILFAVVCGTLGAVALILRHRWAQWLNTASLVAIAVQSMWMFAMADLTSILGGHATMMQLTVLAIALGLSRLTRIAREKGWLK